jgi:Zn-finger nucleic acid-binding protein
MVVLELQQVELDNCLNCGGIWLDTGELGLLMGTEREARELLAPIANLAPPTRSKRKCPICRHHLEAISVAADQQQVEIDRCPDGHGLWFDRGELRQIVRIIGGERGNKVATLLEDMFRDQF